VGLNKDVILFEGGAMNPEARQAKAVPFLDKDRALSIDIEKSHDFLRQRSFH
jgi:hypothetical protein